MAEKKQKESLWHVIKFTLFSLSAGIIQAVSFTAFNEVPVLLGFAKWPYWACNVPSLVLSVLWNFTLNRRFTFKSANNVPIAMLKVAVFYLIFTPVSSYLGTMATNGGWNEYLVQALVMLSNLVLEFLYQKYFVFRNSINTNDLAKKDK
ncbi:MAG: GtrA family protein [Clostridia bacterium]|nr:GtrA family protein [Clostridia bacterium]